MPTFLSSLTATDFSWLQKRHANMLGRGSRFDVSASVASGGRRTNLFGSLWLPRRFLPLAHGSLRSADCLSTEVRVSARCAMRVVVGHRGMMKGAVMHCRQGPAESFSPVGFRPTKAHRFWLLWRCTRRIIPCCPGQPISPTVVSQTKDSRPELPDTVATHVQHTRAHCSRSPVRTVATYIQQWP